MHQKKKAVFNWSGGKDSALALQKTLQENEFDVVSLLTTINKETLKSTVHSLPLEILYRQAESIGIPIHTVNISDDLKDYDEKMKLAVHHFKIQGVTNFIFGDLQVSNIKSYREKKLNPLGINVIEPLWNKSSQQVRDEFLKSGIKAKLIVTQADKLDKSYIGKDLDYNLISSFPDDIDPCGENGEYHTIAYAGDIFKDEILFSIEEINKISYDIKLENGIMKSFSYWQADINLKP